MATVTVGQFAVSDCVVKIKTASNTYSTIADLEEMSLSIDNNIETWYSISGGGWQNALMTARALTGSFSGKRTIGDTGNDYLNSKRYSNSTDCNEDWRIEFPDGSTLDFNAVTALTDIMGAATDVAPLSGDLTGRGQPTFTAATSL